MNHDENRNVEFFQCLTSGVCGSGGGLCAPPPPLPCQPNACQPGYQCGQYGCARNRARSALTKKVVSEDRMSSMIFLSDSSLNFFPRSSSSILAIIAVIRNNSSFQNPNFIFRKCCEQRGLPDACLNKCNFNFYTKDALQEMYFKIDGCPIEATADMHFCAAQGRDHTECCHQNGVATTLAGIKCLTFCDQRPNRIIKLDYSYVPCYERFEQMKQCFYKEIRNKAQEQFGFT
ncbi:unnamed protein product [Angiostrongylus costaricensis]|uniref:DB domain-containing protein n=1 Tax=Angiostrongylus costaricensis TaxID=334426 RepID=A0A0R3PFU0_ANGCS|nr:unnamed protein product [Angiostrongylus costaricensis]